MQKEIHEKLLRRHIISHLGWFQKRPHPPSPLVIFVTHPVLICSLIQCFLKLCIREIAIIDRRIVQKKSATQLL